MTDKRKPEAMTAEKIEEIRKRAEILERGPSENPYSAEKLAGEDVPAILSALEDAQTLAREWRELVLGAAQDMGLNVGPEATGPELLEAIGGRVRAAEKGRDEARRREEQASKRAQKMVERAQEWRNVWIQTAERLEIQTGPETSGPELTEAIVERVRKCDGMAREHNILVRENREQAARVALLEEALAWSPAAERPAGHFHPEAGTDAEVRADAAEGEAVDRAAGLAPGWHKGLPRNERAERLAARVAELRARLGALASEVCGAPELDPHNRDDLRWCSALEEARMLRERVAELEGALATARVKTLEEAERIAEADLLDQPGVIVAAERRCDGGASERAARRIAAKLFQRRSHLMLSAVPPEQASRLAEVDAVLAPMRTPRQVGELAPTLADEVAELIRRVEAAEGSSIRYAARVAQLEGALCHVRGQRCIRDSNEFHVCNCSCDSIRLIIDDALVPVAPPEQAPGRGGGEDAVTFAAVFEAKNRAILAALERLPMLAHGEEVGDDLPEALDFVRARLEEALPLNEEQALYRVAPAPPRTNDGARTQALQDAARMMCEHCATGRPVANMQEFGWQHDDGGEGLWKCEAGPIRDLMASGGTARAPVTVYCSPRVEERAAVPAGDKLLNSPIAMRTMATILNGTPAADPLCARDIGRGQKCGHPVSEHHARGEFCLHWLQEKPGFLSASDRYCPCPGFVPPEPPKEKRCPCGLLVSCSAPESHRIGCPDLAKTQAEKAAAVVGDNGKPWLCSTCGRWVPGSATCCGASNGESGGAR